MLRCVCRADKQSSLRASSFSALLSRASLSTSSTVAAPSSSTPSSSTFTPSSSFSTSSSTDARRVAFTPPENYPRDPSSISGESPLTKRIKEGSAAAAASTSGLSDARKLFRPSGSMAINPERKIAKQLGKDYKESQQELESSDTIPDKPNVRRPIGPTDSRTLTISGGEDFARQYRRLMNGVIGQNNIRDELRRQERYEKPKYKRQRLRSARHRRRFANEVGLRVAAVLRAKSQGM